MRTGSLDKQDDVGRVRRAATRISLLVLLVFAVLAGVATVAVGATYTKVVRYGPYTIPAGTDADLAWFTTKSSSA